MKKLTFLLCLAAVSCRQVPENEFHIEGHLTGVKDGTVIYLSVMDGDVGRSVATDTLTNGRFSFVLPLAQAALLSLDAHDSPEFPSMARDIWAAPGEKAVVTGDNTFLYTWKVESRVPEQKIADRYMLRSESEYNQMAAIFMKLDEWHMRYRIKHPDAGASALHDSLNQALTDLYLTISRNDIAVMNETEVSDIWLEQLLASSYMVEDLDQIRPDVEKLYERLTPEQRELPAAQEIRLNLFPPQEADIGDMMPGARLKDPEGNFHTLSDYLGKYILLEFWSSGCGGCYESMPELREIKGKYGDVLNIIGINIDTSESSWAKGSEMFGLTWLDLHAPQGNDLQVRYGVSGIPHKVLISPEGVILASWTECGKGFIETMLQEFIKPNSSHR